jgi:hypothetical protein
LKKYERFSHMRFWLIAPRKTPGRKFSTQ